MTISVQVKDGAGGHWDLRNPRSQQPAQRPLLSTVTPPPCPMSLAKKVKGLSVHGCWAAFSQMGRWGSLKHSNSAGISAVLPMSHPWWLTCHKQKGHQTTSDLGGSWGPKCAPELVHEPLLPQPD